MLVYQRVSDMENHRSAGMFSLSIAAIFADPFVKSSDSEFQLVGNPIGVIPSQAVQHVVGP
jgi:hypothetical protein